MESSESSESAVSGESLALAQRVLVATLVIVSVLLVLLLVWYAADLLMLIFAGILVSIPLRRLKTILEEWTGWGHGASLAIVTAGFSVAIGLLVWLIADRVASQAAELTSQLSVAVETLRLQLAGYAWAQEVIDRVPDLQALLEGGGMLSRLGGFATATLGGVISTLVVIVVGIYVASQPELYSQGIKHLLPFRNRQRAGEVIDVIDGALERWLLGRLVLMVINGVLTTIALWLLGVPLASTLGVLAGLMNFIPNFGPFIAAAPAVLLAFVVSPTLALYTAAVYLVVQMVDGYVLTPIVDRKSVELPPVVTISGQILLGLLFGFVGLLVASPLTAVAMILVKMLYIEDVLGDPIMQGSRFGNGEPRPFPSPGTAAGG